ncbi:MAG: 4Fe-4S dicluster domain-containing protein, partial [Gammaproteobacteria bacterium]|nr:4Fe-4S dicluster domain-containing protein [Gammaproteobacteria bacterium]
MRTTFVKSYAGTEEGRIANDILRRCVHCGFCNAVCPTYQLLGNELDGPRGRIYLIKQMLEGNAVSAHSQLHLDRCLLCRACESACPSGVEYSRLLEIGRNLA